MHCGILQQHKNCKIINKVQCRHWKRAEDKQKPLHTATYYGSKVVVKLLIEHKSETTARGLDKETPLHTTVSCNRTKVAKAWFSCKAGIDENKKNNQTPLHNAAK